MNALAPIYSFWHGGALGFREAMCLSSFLKFGHEVTLFSYNSALEVPKGVRLTAAATVIPETDKAYEMLASKSVRIAFFADIFRYAILRRHGGCWVDTDVVGMNPLFMSDKAIIGKENVKQINNAVICAPAGHPLIEEAYATAHACDRQKGWADIGPLLITKLAARYSSSVDVRPCHVFYPLNHLQAVEMLCLPENRDTCADMCSGATMLHLYNEMFGLACIPKQMLPPKGSYLHDLFTAFLPENHGLPVMDVEMVRRLDGYGARDRVYRRCAKVGLHRVLAVRNYPLAVRRLAGRIVKPILRKIPGGQFRDI